HFLAVIEAGQRIGLAVVLVQDVEFEGVGPPLHVGLRNLRGASMHYRTFAASTALLFCHGRLLRSVNCHTWLTDDRQGLSGPASDIGQVPVTPPLPPAQRRFHPASFSPVA